MEAHLLHLTQFASVAPAQYFIASLWQGLVLTAVAWLAFRALAHTRITIAPGARFALWMIVFFLSAVLPLSSLIQSHAASAPSVSQGPFAAAHLSAIWAVAIVAIWAAASLFSMARMLWNLYRLDVLARTSFPLPAEALSQDLLSLLRNSGGRKRVDLCLSDRIDSPMVIGFLRPAIMVPRWLWRKLSPSEMNQIVMHELAHLRRGDDWTNLLQKFLRALFPLNPALLFAERQLCWEREMACDDAVLGAAINPKEYATCLTSLAENRLLRRVQSLAPSAWQRRSELSRRVHRVLAHKRALRPVHSGVIFAAFLTAYLGGGLILARCPRFITFTMNKETSAAGTKSIAELRNYDGGSAPRLLPARMPSQGSPHIVDATFRTLAPAARTRHSRSTSALHEKERSSLGRSAKQRPAPAYRQASLTRPRNQRSNWGHMYLTQALFTEPQFSQSIPASAAPKEAAGKGRPSVMGTQGRLAESSSSSSRPDVVFYLSLSSSPSADPGDPSLPSRITISRLDNGWIVIQL